MPGSHADTDHQGVEPHGADSIVRFTYAKIRHDFLPLPMLTCLQSG
jgi:hypothetical protein